MSLVKFASDAMEISLGYNVSPLEGFATKLAAEANEGDTYGRNIGAGMLAGGAAVGLPIGALGSVAGLGVAAKMNAGVGKSILAGLAAGAVTGGGAAAIGAINGGIYGGLGRLGRDAYGKATGGIAPDTYGANMAAGAAINTAVNFKGPGPKLFGLKSHAFNALTGAAMGAGAKYIRDKWSEK